MSRSSSTDTEHPPPARSSRDAWLALSDDDLLSSCRFERFRVSGAGGQHRNMTDSAVRLTHEPSGAIGYASERRSQRQNRAVALARLRREIALRLRADANLELYHPPAALQRILPRGASAAGTRNEQVGRAERVGPRHRAFWAGVAPLLDLFASVDGSVGDCAALLGCSTNQLIKLLASEPHLWSTANALRERDGLNSLRR